MVEVGPTTAQGPEETEVDDSAKRCWSKSPKLPGITASRRVHHLLSNIMVMPGQMVDLFRWYGREGSCIFGRIGPFPIEVGNEGRMSCSSSLRTVTDAGQMLDLFG